METVAFELVPPDLGTGPQEAGAEARKLVEHARVTGLTDRIRHVMIPGMIVEDDDRPVEMKPRMDTLDFWHIVRAEIEGIGGLCTQVTAFHDRAALAERLRLLRAAGMEGVTFVGVPRTMADGEGPGTAPTDALAEFADIVPNRGAILIPTREGEAGRFGFKCRRGATFGMTQLLYSDAIVGFLTEFARAGEHRPEILLSFGYVPAAEARVRLLDWLIQDPGNREVAAEQEFVARLADSDFATRKTALVELYRRVIDGVVPLGFPLSIHLEAPYGASKAAFETFAEMLDYWEPGASR